MTVESTGERLAGTRLFPPALEDAFRARHLPHDAQLASGVIATMTLLTVPFMVSDVNFIADRGTLVALWCARAIFVTVSAAAAWVAWRARRPATLDYAVLLWLLAASADEVAVQSTRPHGYLLPLLNVVMAVTLAWLVLPSRFSFQALGAAALTASAATWVLLFRDRLTASEGRLVGTVGLAFNLLLAVVSFNVHRVRRRQYLGLRAVEQAEARSKQTEEQLAAVIEGSRAGYLDIDLVKGTAYRSPRYWDIVGWPKDALPATPFSMREQVHPDDAPRTSQVIAGMIGGTMDHCDEDYRLRTKDGRWVWVKALLKVIARDAAGKPTRIAGTVTDAEESHHRQALALESARLHGLSDRMNETELLVGLDGVIVEANDRALTLYQASRAELIGHDLAELRAQGAAPDTDTELRAATEAGTRYESAHRRRDGSTFPVEVSARLVKANGTGYLHCLVRDLTEARARAAELKLLADITRTMEDAVLVVDREFRVLAYANAAERVLGWSEAELRGLRPAERMQTEYLDGDGEAHFQRLREGHSSHVNVRLTRKDGQRIDVELTAVPRRDEQGAVIGHFGVLRDVTAKRVAERTLVANEERLRTIVASMAEGLVLHDASGAIVSCNAAAERILGLSRAQLEGRTSIDPRWRSIKEDGAPFPGEEHPAQVTLRTGQAQRAVMMGVHRPDGTVAWVSISSEPLRLAPGSAPYAVVVSFSDLTERKKGEDALLASLAANQRLVADLQEAALKVKTLSGLLPICMHCKKIRDDAGYWERIESYITTHSGALFSHGVCPECLATHYPNFDDDKG